MIFRVTCWVNPQTEFDLTEKKEVEDFILSMCDLMNSPRAKQVFKKSDHNGKILKDFRIELNHDIDDIKTELMPEIWKDFPEAELSSWDRVDRKVNDSCISSL
jgi:hypothetical protein